MNNFDVLLGMKLGGGGSSSTLVSKTITANGTYNPADDNADGYSSVTANVPNTYTVADEGKVVDSGALVGQTAKNIDANGLYDTTLNNSVSVDVPNSYTAGDEGKVVSGGTLVSQTAYPSTIVANGTYDTTLNNSVTVDVPPVGVVVEKDVNFYDYDGTLVYSYTAQEFLALSELPANPTHTGLTAQGWNWTLADAQAWVTSYGYVDIGQCYITDDGNTRIHVNITTDSGNEIVLGAHAEFDSSYTDLHIDWGDGTNVTDRIRSRRHIYQTTGRYTIIISKVYNSSTVYLGSDNGMPIVTPPNWEVNHGQFIENTVEAVEMGDAQFYGNGGFRNLSNLKTCTIPKTVTELKATIFSNCHNLIHITIPNIPLTYYQAHSTLGIEYCYNLKRVCFIKEAYLLASGSNTLFSFYYAFSLKLRVPYWEGTVYPSNRYSEFVYMPFPNRCTEISEYAFAYRRYADHRTDVTIPNTVTKIGNYAFYYAWDIATLTVPNSVTSLGSNCCSYADIHKIMIDTPTIQSSFANNSQIQELEIGSSVTRINQSAFSTCYRLKSIKFLGSTPPTVANANAFQFLPTTCTIYVPTGSLSDYTSASNYPNPSTHTYVEY